MIPQDNIPSSPYQRAMRLLDLFTRELDIFAQGGDADYTALLDLLAGMPMPEAEDIPDPAPSCRSEAFAGLDEDVKLILLRNALYDYLESILEGSQLSRDRVLTTADRFVRHYRVWWQGHAEDT